MIYEIQSKSDFLTGATLTVRIPEDDLDKKALSTILTDKPEFILPFRSRCIDGRVEFVYQIGTHSKLQYLSGSRTTKEYAELWAGVLRPLLDCGDWFMKPYSFLLNIEYLYCDKNKGTVNYVYIPSIHDCSGYDDLKVMAAEVSKLVTVADSNLENKVLRAIMKDFKPNDFLEMLKAYTVEGAYKAQQVFLGGRSPAVEPGLLPLPREQGAPSASTLQAIRPATAEHGVRAVPPQGKQHPAAAARIQAQPPVEGIGGSRLQKNAQTSPGDIVINIPSSPATPKKTAGIQKNGKNTDSREKDTKKQKSAVSLFGRKTKAQHEIVADIAPAPPVVFEPEPPPEPAHTPPADIKSETQTFSIATGGSGFRLVGSSVFPPVIDIQISEGDVFTIGRYDAATGRRQSNFEFDKKTKAVSRRHAAVERKADSYNIIDLASSAGTFVDGRKLPPNTPCELGAGSRVSFGNAGADYVWER